MILTAAYFSIGVGLSIGLVRMEAKQRYGAPEMPAVASPLIIMGWPIIVVMAVIYVLGTGKMEYPGT